VQTISIIIPCYNRERFVAEALESAFGQGYPRLEVIVVDDGSTDGSADTVGRFPEARLIRQRNCGVSGARNNGLKVSRGALIVFLDSDDRLAPRALSQAASMFDADPSLAMAFGGNRIIDENGKPVGVNVQPARRFDYWDVLEGMTPSPSQCMFRRTALEAAGGFDPAISLSEDWDLYLRLARIGGIVCHGRIVADYRTHPGQTRVPAKALRSALNILEAHGRSARSADEAARFRAAKRHRKIYFGQFLLSELARNLLNRDMAKCALSLKEIALSLPYSVSGAFRHLWARYSARRVRLVPPPGGT